MNPDYYKTYEKDLYDKALERIYDMDDDQLEVRYGKMKKADKIGAFYEALVDQDRAPRVRKRIEKDGCVPPAKKEEEMKFVRVTRDDFIENGIIRRQAIFTYNNEFFLYSYTKDETIDIHETMTFRCDEDGDSDWKELFVGAGYIHSKDAMKGTLANILSNSTDASPSFHRNSNYALEA